MTWEAYSTKLSSFGVLVKVRNFLVFQASAKELHWTAILSPRVALCPSCLYRPSFSGSEPFSVCSTWLIIPPTPHCLTGSSLSVCQGDIEAVAAKSPMELTHLFEQISGSDAHKRHYDELQQSQAKAEEKVGGGQQGPDL